jgi:acetyl-CoA C-acetyltransferase
MKELRRIAILGGVRIPFARQNNQYIGSSNMEMLTVTLRSLAQRFNLVGERLGEVAAGAVLKHTRDFSLTREATIASGIATQTPAYDVQQACATSLQSAILVGNKIGMSQIDVGIAGGVDSASDAPIALSEGMRLLVLQLNRAKSFSERMHALAKFRPKMLLPSVPNVNERRSGLSMGQHCELMVKEWRVGRLEQDELTLASHRNGIAAYKAGFYDNLIEPYRGLNRDNNLREDTSMEKLARLKPVFDTTSGFGTLTAGNSTPLTDGAGAVLLSSENWAQSRGFEPQAWVVDSESAAVEYVGPGADGLLMAPAYAVARLLARNGLQLQDFDYYEIHEAFAGQVLCTLKAWESQKYCRNRLGLDTALGSIDRSKLNINGGSVGLGHPFAATGARIIAGAAKQLALHRERHHGTSARTLISVCAAGGLGAAAILEG